MRTKWLKTMCAAGLILVVTGWGWSMAADVNEENAISAQERPVPPEEPMPGSRFGPGPEHIEQMLAQIREKDPQKADELAKLRELDPEAFRLEFRKVMREHFMDQMREQKGEPGRPSPFAPNDGATQGRQDRRSHGPVLPEGTPEMEPWMMPSGPFEGHGPEMMQERMQEKGEEYMKWLKENFPDEAMKLEQMKQDNPRQYMRAAGINWKKYGRIFRASKDNPQLAAVLKEQMSLKDRRMELLKQIKAATDEMQKKTLTSELEQVVGQHFDLIVKRKELAYEDLAKKLTELQKEVDQKKADVEKWKSKDFKSEQVKQRVNELVTDTGKFEWE